MDSFPEQSIDFFGAARARFYDDAVWKWTEETGFDQFAKKLVNAREGKAQVPMPTISLDILMEYGNQLRMEQEMVKREKLAEKYMYVPSSLHSL